MSLKHSQHLELNFPVRRSFYVEKGQEGTLVPKISYFVFNRFAVDSRIEFAWNRAEARLAAYSAGAEKNVKGRGGDMCTIVVLRLQVDWICDRATCTT